QGQHPRVDDAVLEVLALPTERARARPRGDDEIVRFLEALAVVRRVDVVGEVLYAATAHKPGDQPTARDAVDHRQLLGQPQRVVDDRQWRAEHQDPYAFGDLGQHGTRDIDRRLHAKRRGVVLVDHDAVEA